MSVPRTTSPLTKSIRTLEGWLVVGANVALVVVPVLTSSLPPELAAKLAAGLDAVYAVSRALVKALSPTPRAPLSPASPPSPETVEKLAKAQTTGPLPALAKELAKNTQQAKTPTAEVSDDREYANPASEADVTDAPTEINVAHLPEDQRPPTDDDLEHGLHPDEGPVQEEVPS